jgi:hypothetical protein
VDAFTNTLGQHRGQAPKREQARFGNEDDRYALLAHRLYLVECCAAYEAGQIRLAVEQERITEIKPARRRAIEKVCTTLEALCTGTGDQAVTPLIEDTPTEPLDEDVLLDAVLHTEAQLLLASKKIVSFNATLSRSLQRLKETGQGGIPSRYHQLRDFTEPATQLLFARPQ